MDSKQMNKKNLEEYQTFMDETNKFHELTSIKVNQKKLLNRNVL